MIKQLKLFQLCDSNFPSGGFTQSFGMETYIQNDEIHDADSFSQWMEMYLDEQLVSSDGLGVRIVYDALETGDLDKIWDLDRLLHIQSFSKETRNGTQHMGKSMMRMVKAIYDDPIINKYDQRIKQKLSYGHSAIVFAMAGHMLKVSRKETILYYLYTIIVNLVQNAVRAIPLGQTDGQKIIFNFRDKLEKSTHIIEKLDEEDFGTVAPAIEVAQMQHEHVNIRIFMS